MKLKVTARIKKIGMGGKLSEYTGHCQGCGRKQMLPGGLLAKHGYTVQWQMFVGVCPGSGHEPYEVSCEFVKQCIVDTEKRIRQFEAQIETVKSAPITNKISRMKIYDPKKYKEVIVYDGELFWDPTAGRGGRGALMVKDSKGKVYEYSSNPILPGKEEEKILEIATSYRKLEVQRMVDHLQSMHDYIEWQQKRVDDWKPVELNKIERDPQKQALNRQELDLLKQISDKCTEMGYYEINSRSSYVVSHKVTFGRVVKLAELGYLNIVERGHNSDGDFIRVTMSEKGIEALTAPTS
jgi:hypothetical protein